MSGYLWDSGSFSQHLSRIPAQDLSTSWTRKLLALAVAVPLPTPCRAGARLEVSVCDVCSEKQPLRSLGNERSSPASLEL